MTLFRFFFSLFFISFLFNSCSSIKPKNDDYHLDTITNINNESYWDMQAKMSIRLGDGTSERINMLWRQSGKRSTIEFSGTFGLGSHVIKVQSDGSATITSSKLNESAESLEALWQQFSPLPLPINALSYWVKGEANPFTMKNNFIESTEPKTKSFEQQDWQITMSKYVDRKTYNMPNKIKLSNGTQSATVLIDNWTFY